PLRREAGPRRVLWNKRLRAQRLDIAATSITSRRRVAAPAWRHSESAFARLCRFRTVLAASAAGPPYRPLLSELVYDVFVLTMFLRPDTPDMLSSWHWIIR